ncbi:pph-5 [Symbiodinium natans]|uniref:Pph-5 protein n=1 Tax=Symbiodinium natans TaxID=878477 RepID=A0A812M5L4_9DINO|nr:pph-5 [Symbiodinium natans]
MAQMAQGDINSQAFWNEFMRRPDAKAAYQAERRLQEKKRQWLEERRVVEERAEHRRLLADALEEAPADLKKLIAPMFHIRFVEDYLWMIYDECSKKQKDFKEKLRDGATADQLRKMRENFQAGGEERMADMEKEWHAQCKAMSEAEEKKKEILPQSIDIHTLKHVLEYAQECKREGNLKFQEGLYEEALHIYSQADDAMKKWKVARHLKNEEKWLKDYHLACLKNKAQAALKLELFQTALDASEAALGIDAEDHKAWYRKVQAEKGLGRFKEAEESLAKLEDVAQWCPDRRRILRDCEAERKRIKVARVKHRQSTQEMLGKAFEAGVFSIDRDRELEEAAKKLEEPPSQMQVSTEPRPKGLEAARPLERNIHLTAALAGDLMDELAAAYGQKWFQERVRKCARDSGFERSVFLMRLKDVAFEVQKPVLEKWGFEGNEHGVREMTAAIREHAGRSGKDMPQWLKEKQDRCLELLYGGPEGGMLDILK